MDDLLSIPDACKDVFTGKIRVFLKYFGLTPSRGQEIQDVYRDPCTFYHRFAGQDGWIKDNPGCSVHGKPWCPGNNILILPENEKVESALRDFVFVKRARSRSFLIVAGHPLTRWHGSGGGDRLGNDIDRAVEKGLQIHGKTTDIQKAVIPVLRSMRRSISLSGRASCLLTDPKIRIFFAPRFRARARIAWRFFYDPLFFRNLSVPIFCLHHLKA
jgi:hypothetical protein